VRGGSGGRGEVGHDSRCSMVTGMPQHNPVLWELRPVLTRGAVAMDALSPDDDGSGTLVSRLVAVVRPTSHKALEHDDERGT
jgi:hypothetical protein